MPQLFMPLWRRLKGNLVGSKFGIHKLLFPKIMLAAVLSALTYFDNSSWRGLYLADTDLRSIFNPTLMGWNHVSHVSGVVYLWL